MHPLRIGCSCGRAGLHSLEREAHLIRVMVRVSSGCSRAANDPHVNGERGAEERAGVLLKVRATVRVGVSVRAAHTAHAKGERSTEERADVLWLDDAIEHKERGAEGAGGSTQRRQPTLQRHVHLRLRPVDDREHRECRVLEASRPRDICAAASEDEAWGSGVGGRRQVVGGGRARRA